MTEWLVNRTGPGSIPGGCESVAFYALDGNKDGWPDLELMLVSGSITSDVTFRDGLGLDLGLYDKVNLQKSRHPSRGARSHTTARTSRYRTR